MEFRKVEKSKVEKFDDRAFNLRKSKSEGRFRKVEKSKRISKGLKVDVVTF